MVRFTAGNVERPENLDIWSLGRTRRFRAPAAIAIAGKLFPQSARRWLVIGSWLGTSGQANLISENWSTSGSAVKLTLRSHSLILLFVFFFLMIRRPPRSTLFPYTMLFA